ncbi:MAG: DUF2147 domain-containing protein [Bacteroidetes bacterium]|nr:DUF2147 domain-containing protein [Bacteroidota bacterium]MBL6943196.1 DUF2147 domain-containing protein [Bacteroidales bacterium]
MKKMSMLIALVGMMISPLMQVQAQGVVADDILGVWLNEDKDAHIDVYKEGDKFYGKIIWLGIPIDPDTGKPKLDKHNPDPALKTRPSLGILLLTDFVFDEDEWEDGDIYDPKSGKTYSCYMEFPDEDNLDNLKIRGYIGFSLLGRTTYWTRVK